MNKSRNFIKRVDTNNKRKLLINYKNEKAKIIWTSLPLIGVIFIYTLQSIIATSKAFSTELATFSLIVTISFELNEWWIFGGNPDGKLAKFLKLFPPILLIVIVVEIYSLLHNGIITLIGTKIPAELAQILPNLITSSTLFGYILSYTIRSILVQKKKYLS